MMLFHTYLHLHHPYNDLHRCRFAPLAFRNPDSALGLPRTNALAYFAEGVSDEEKGFYTTKTCTEEGKDC
jgi:hypothetical protein